MPSIIKALPASKRKQIESMYKKGYSYRQIAETLTSEGYSITHTSIARYIKRKGWDKLKRRKKRRVSITLEEAIIEKLPKANISASVNQILKEWFQQSDIFDMYALSNKIRQRKYQKEKRKTTITIDEELLTRLKTAQMHTCACQSDYVVQPSNPKLSLKEWADIVSPIMDTSTRVRPSLSKLISAILDDALNHIPKNS